LTDTDSRSHLFIIGLTTLMLLPIVTVFHAPGTDGAVVPDPFETPDGLMWAPPQKVTENDLDDRYPSIRVDPDGNANIVYLQSGSDYIWCELEPPNTMLVPEKRLLSGYIPTQYQVKNESTAQPTEHFDIGPDGSLHVVWTEAGLLDNRYQRFDEEGEPLTGVIPMDQITDLSRLPYLVVGQNGRAYIAFENEGTAWVQMTYVDEEGFIRAPALIGRPGENVAFAKGLDGTMHLFYRSLGADVSLFHVKLDQDRMPIVPNNIIFPNTSKVANPYSSMPNIAITADGHVHLLISDTTIAPHPIYYIELDEDGTPISNFTKVVDGAYNYGDIIGDPENHVYVFWDDSQDGEVHYIKIVDGVPGEEVTITSTGGSARYPQVMSDLERGDLHLAYVDISEGGEGEIFYRYANGYRIGLEVQGLEDALEVHPGGDPVELGVLVTNIADVSNKVKVSADVDYHGLEGHGWSFELVASEVELGPDGDSELFTATLQGPVNGTEGESIDITISVVPERSSAKAKALGFTSTLTIRHALSFTGPSKVPLLDDVTDVELVLSNNGDVDEEVNLTVTGGAPGWEVSLDQDGLLLPRGMSEELNLRVELPTWVGADVVSGLKVQARPSSEASAIESHEIMTVAYPALYPAMSTPRTELALPPGGSVDIPLNISNRGLANGEFELSAIVSQAQGVWDVDMDPVSVVLEPDAEKQVNVVVRSPQEALAGTGLVLDIILSDASMSIQEDMRFVVSVLEQGGLVVAGGGNATVYPGEKAVFHVRIYNNGNSPRGIDLSVQSLPSGWKWQFWNGQVLSHFEMAPLSSLDLELEVTPPANALSGVVDIVGTVEAQGKMYEVMASVHVLSLYGSEIDVDVPIVKAELGTEVNFTVRLSNTGTAADEYSLLVGDLPAGASYKVLDSGADVMEISVDPGETVELELLVQLPSTMKAWDFSFWVGAASTSGTVVRSDLIVEFRLPDIRIKDVVFDDKDIEAGQKRDVKVLLANSGDADADEFKVIVNGIDKGTSLAPGQDGELTFEVEFEAGDSQLVVVVDPGNEVPEKKEDNNIQVVEVDVEGGAGAVPGLNAVYIIIAISISFIVVQIIRKSP
jgi:uncharacterized membrane protein